MDKTTTMEIIKTGNRYKIVLGSGHTGLLLAQNTLWINKETREVVTNYYCRPCKEWHHIKWFIKN